MLAARKVDRWVALMVDLMADRLEQMVVLSVATTVVQLAVHLVPH